MTKIILMLSVLVLSLIGCKDVLESDYKAAQVERCEDSTVGCDEFYQEAGVSSSFKSNMSEVTQVSSTTQNQSSETIALSSSISLGSSSSVASSCLNTGVFKICASGLNSSGFYGATESVKFLAYSDVFSGGSSNVLSPSGTVLNQCAENENICDISKTFVMSGSDIDYSYSKLKIIDFVPSSKSSWGWAAVSWWVLPSYNKVSTNSIAFDKAVPAGLTENSWLSMSISYTAGQTLTLELKGEDIDNYDPNQSPPRFSYTGTGAFEVVHIPMKSIKRAGWSNPTTYDATKVTGIGLLRMDQAHTEGAQFPSSAPETTDFKFKCISAGSFKGDNACE